MIKRKLWMLLLVGLFVSGCQTFRRSRVETQVEVTRTAESKVYEAKFVITEGRGEEQTVIARPRVRFRAGNRARTEVGNEERMVRAQVYIRDSDDDSPAGVYKVWILENGKQTYYDSKVIFLAPRE
ncbi:MAG: hypothetical protein ACKVHO_12420 [Verrucomicrobiia bacterium]|jgi:outer membrane lipoprotein-sorting protein